ncbi:hypothetical protein, partial [Paraburkholderia bengalensis]|uniref:hypothetical protein n=1 Tax=Paraburkholderia bengalensis TaxID=2747562 RepID=UPI003015328E
MRQFDAHFGGRNQPVPASRVLQQMFANTEAAAEPKAVAGPACVETGFPRLCERLPIRSILFGPDSLHRSTIA